MGKAAKTRKFKFFSLKTFTRVSVWIIAAILIAGPSFLHSKMGIGVSPILTGSMRPYANSGDVFITAPTKATALKVGDIISIHNQKSGVFYAHRIIEIRSQSNLLRITTKGDANGAAEIDPFLVGADKTVPRVFMTLDWIGHPLVYLTGIQGRQASYSLLILANLIALFFYLFKKREQVTGEIVEKCEHLPELISATTKNEILNREIKLANDFINEHIEESKLFIFHDKYDARSKNDELMALALVKDNN